MDGHLDLLALDALRAGEGSAEERAHLEACAECRATVDGFGRLARALAPAPIAVPADLKRRVLAAARPRRAWRPLAAAAAVLIALGAAWFFVAQSPARPRRLDIVDAYTLAVRLKTGQAVEAAYDVNGDGKVDERDVEEIVRRSVALR
jgi:predicted anti-sigma-YlaC factor YlaD